MQAFEGLNMDQGQGPCPDFMSNSALASGSSSSPASRQKSCNACVRGKRRCDKTKPRCTRCATKGLDCVYQRLPSSVNYAGSSQNDSSAAAISSNDSLAPEPCPESIELNYGVGNADLSDDFDMGGFDVSDMGSGCSSGHAATATTATTSPDSLTLDPSLDFSIIDLLNGTHSTSGQGQSGDSLSNLWNLPGFTEPKSDFPSIVLPMQMPQQRRIIRDIALFHESAGPRNCITVDPLLIHDPRSKMGFMVDTLVKLHTGFVRTRLLPFSHPRLYHEQPVPKTIMIAFCAAATYTARTPATKGWAYKAVQDATAEVHREGAAATTYVEKLARCHALLVLETIRFYDGDAGMRYASERESGKLKEWGLELLDIKDELDEANSTHLTSRETPPPSWDAWVLHESIRRTAMICFAFQCFISILKAEKPEPDLMTRDTPFTASRHLWEATTSVEFHRAWRDEPQWTVRNFEFGEFWMYGRPEDLDDFTRIMLTIQVGPDAMDHFMQGEAAAF